MPHTVTRKFRLSWRRAASLLKKDLDRAPAQRTTFEPTLVVDRELTRC
jgi:hypothetical protein